MSRMYPSGGFQTPERSGLPSGSRGAGADMFGLPSVVRGMVERGTLLHCAETGAPSTMTIANGSSFFMALSVLRCSSRREETVRHAS